MRSVASDRMRSAVAPRPDCKPPSRKPKQPTGLKRVSNEAPTSSVLSFLLSSGLGPLGPRLTDRFHEEAAALYWERSFQAKPLHARPDCTEKLRKTALNTSREDHDHVKS